MCKVSYENVCASSNIAQVSLIAKHVCKTFCTPKAHCVYNYQEYTYEVMYINTEHYFRIIPG